MEDRVTKNSQETRKYAIKLAQLLTPGDIICLYGDLGAGKTTFIQGVAKGLGIEKRITSPTFVIIRSYDFRFKNTNIERFYHVDLYRLPGESDIEGTGLLDILSEKNAIVAIEWPVRLGTLLPKKRWEVKMEFLGETKRSIFFDKF